MPMFVKYLLVAPQRLAQGPDQADGDGGKPWLRSGKVASNKLISASTKASRERPRKLMACCWRAWSVTSQIPLKVR